MCVGFWKKSSQREKQKYDFTLFDRDVSAVHHGDKNCLSQRILQSEEFIFGHRRGSSPQNSLKFEKRLSHPHDHLDQLLVLIQRRGAPHPLKIRGDTTTKDDAIRFSRLVYND